MLELIEKLLLKENLTTQECKAVAEEMLTGKHLCKTAAFLMLMRSKGETVDELLGFVEVMRDQMVRVSVPFPVLDIVGTGGDGMHTLNISTASAIVAASCEVKIAKHGNRSASSLCGSADVLEALGIAIDTPPEKIGRSIEQIGIGFMFAPRFHPALQHLKEVRKELGTRTLFNIIAPLLNPAHAQHFMLGVFDEALLEIIAELLLRLNVKRSFVFHGCGLDELSCVGPAQVLEVNQGNIRRIILDPQELGLKRCALKDLQGKDACYNADKILEALSGKESPFADTLALNAGVAIYLYGKAETVRDGIEMAKVHLQKKKGEELLAAWRNYEAIAKLHASRKSKILAIPCQNLLAGSSDGGEDILEKVEEPPSGQGAAKGRFYAAKSFAIASMSNYLMTILEDKQREVSTLPQPIRLKQVLQKEGLSVIAEIKRRSPSKGMLHPSLDCVWLAKEYVAGGAAAISVLTDSGHFGGSMDDLKAVIAACPGIPVLRKDFIIDEKQLYETARAGAHAVLLIAALLHERLGGFVQLAKGYGLETLVEVHNLDELKLAQSTEAEIIGVNNRNLATFEIALETSLALAPHFAPSVVKVAESGIFTAVDAAQVSKAGYDAILVGEALVKATDPQEKIREFCHAH